MHAQPRARSAGLSALLKAGRDGGRRHDAPEAVQRGLGAAERYIYVVAAMLLVGAAALTIVGTVRDLIAGAGARRVEDAAIFVLERGLLLFIIAELLYTLRVVNLGGRIHVEPFLLVGLIAVVRRILVVTAEVEGQSGDNVTDFVIQIAALAGLALVLTLSIYVLRHGASAARKERHAETRG
jgi:uncharacterized membrane protein (DUF373 family)